MHGRDRMNSVFFGELDPLDEKSIINRVDRSRDAMDRPRGCVVDDVHDFTRFHNTTQHRPHEWAL